MTTLPIEPNHRPLVLLEMILRLKVRDVMTTKISSVTRDATLKDVQDIMRDLHISGVPVVEHGRLYGLVSIDDIIRGLEGGYINESCGAHMSTRLVVLEDDMPLSFAIQYFEKYKYGRFPVLDKERALVGIVCQRDINRKLLVELSAEFNRMEKETGKRGFEVNHDIYMLHEFPVAKYDFENAGKAANAIKAALQERNIPPRLIRRIAVAAYELEMNLCVHSDCGFLSWQVSDGKSEIIAKDNGPGIADVEWACRDGTSTANEWIRSLGFGAGLGLVNVKRVSDVFDIKSALGSGTTVRSVINLALPEDK